MKLIIINKASSSGLIVVTLPSNLKVVGSNDLIFNDEFFHSKNLLYKILLSCGLPIAFVDETRWLEIRI